MNLNLSRSQIPPPEPAIQVVLASQSIGRKLLLEKLGLRFRVIVTHVNEEKISDIDPVRKLRRRAMAKTEEIINHQAVYHVSEIAKTLLITADSMAIIGKRTFGKALNRPDAVSMLKSLTGKTHVFATVVILTLLDQGKVKKRWEKVIKTKVTLRRMTPVEMESYVARYDFTRFAASYAVNEAPWDVVTKIEGSYTNVIGLPFEVLLPVLRTLKIIV